MMMGYKRPREDDFQIPRPEKSRKVEPIKLGEVRPGMMVRVMPCPAAVHALHSYPFYGKNPCPASRCGWDCMAIETGVGEWRQGVKVRFADGNEWCYNPKALVHR
eukprot:TRINITY_DN19233_c0_g1_i1.p1 TRINITY_DN19233_c0_g1~~TRINITY_DN19233_c0_g1_i1.p1  ORF type:complete len:112 (-),score=1.12 TRINITY_DN19233_c0_g1_i1:8-322(-)